MSAKEEIEVGLMAREAVDAEIVRIAQEKPHSPGCDSASVRVTDRLASLVIRVQGGEIRIRSRLEFLPTLRSTNSETET